MVFHCGLVIALDQITHDLPGVYIPPTRGYHTYPGFPPTTDPGVARKFQVHHPPTRGFNHPPPTYPGLPPPIDHPIQGYRVHHRAYRAYRVDLRAFLRAYRPYRRCHRAGNRPSPPTYPGFAHPTASPSPPSHTPYPGFPPTHSQPHHTPTRGFLPHTPNLQSPPPPTYPGSALRHVQLPHTPPTRGFLPHTHIVNSTNSHTPPTRGFLPPRLETKSPTQQPTTRRPQC